MVTRKQERIRARIKQAEDEYIDKISGLWWEQVPDEYHGFSIEGDLFDDKWAGRLQRGQVVRLKRYLKEPSRFLLMRGTAGLGKSSLSATLAGRLVEEQGRSAVYVSANSMLYEFSYRDEGVNPIKRYSLCPILVIDDLGAINEGITPHQERCLGELIEQRYSNRDRITIITTNMSIQSTSEGLGLRDWIGPRSWDRIQQNLTMVDFNGESMRGDDVDTPTRKPSGIMDM